MARTAIIEVTYDSPITFETLEILMDHQRGFEGVVTVKGRLVTEEAERTTQ